MRAAPTARRVRAARVLALAVDLAQIVLLPTFLPAVASPVAGVADVAVAAALVLLLGWHWAFLPTFLVELIPVVDVVPTWTAAVFLATRSRGGPPATKPDGGAPGSPARGQPRAPSGS